MKGTNTLTLNNATICEAVQYWLDSQLVVGKVPTVTNVEHRKEGMADVFDVTLSSPAELDKEK